MSDIHEGQNGYKRGEIAIIGGGFGGVILGYALHKPCVPFHIYEAAAAFGEIGAGVTFGINTTNALDMISPELVAAFKQDITTNEPADLRGVLTAREKKQAG